MRESWTHVFFLCEHSKAAPERSVAVASGNFFYVTIVVIVLALRTAAD